MIYPKVCPFCGKISSEGICADCRDEVAYISEPRCMKCGKPLKQDTEEFCPDCLAGRSHVVQGGGLWPHREPVAGALYRFKYRNRRHFGRIFARELADQYMDQIGRWGIEEIIPIPLHISRRRSRGFNQAEILARELSDATGIPMRKDVLFRVKKTSPQKALGKRERRGNLKGAFAVSRTWKARKNVLLIDDIYTTGSTIEKAAEMLKKAGAQNVYFLTISIGQGV